MTEAEVLARSVEIARDIVAGTRSRRAGAAEIWVLSSENERACFEELKGFIAAASQWDESPRHHDELLNDILIAAEELVRRHPTT